MGISRWPLAAFPVRHQKPRCGNSFASLGRNSLDRISASTQRRASYVWCSPRRAYFDSNAREGNGAGHSQGVFPILRDSRKFCGSSESASMNCLAAWSNSLNGARKLPSNTQAQRIGVARKNGSCSSFTTCGWIFANAGTNARMPSSANLTAR